MSDFKQGDTISFQTAGMVAPKYGVINRIARQPGYAFVLFDHIGYGVITPLAACKPGIHPSWWHQDAEGRWHSERT